MKLIFPNFVFVNLDSSLFYLYRPVQTFISNHSHIWLCVIAHGKKSFHCNAKEFGKVHNCSEINRSQQWKIVLTNTLQIVYILVFINLHEVKKKLKQLFYVECHVIPHVWSRYTISHKIAVNHFVFFADRCLFLFPKLTKKKMFLNEQIDITSYRMKKKHTQSTSLSYWYQKFQIIKLFKIIF